MDGYVKLVILFYLTYFIIMSQVWAYILNPTWLEDGDLRIAWGVKEKSKLDFDMVLHSLDHNLVL